jgi:hypothetical protein
MRSEPMRTILMALSLLLFSACGSDTNDSPDTQTETQDNTNDITKPEPVVPPFDTVLQALQSIQKGTTWLEIDQAALGKLTVTDLPLTNSRRVSDGSKLMTVYFCRSTEIIEKWGYDGQTTKVLDPCDELIYLERAKLVLGSSIGVLSARAQAYAGTRISRETVATGGGKLVYDLLGVYKGGFGGEPIVYHIFYHFCASDGRLAQVRTITAEGEHIQGDIEQCKVAN